MPRLISWCMGATKLVIAPTPPDIPACDGKLMLPSAPSQRRMDCASSPAGGIANVTISRQAREGEGMTLAPVFGRFAIDPTNTLLSVAALGLAPVHRRWAEAGWLSAPLEASLAAQ